MLSKLTALHINIIGGVITAILCAALFWFLIKPKNEQLTTVEADTSQTQGNGGTAQAVTAAKTDLAKTQVAAKKTTADWGVNEQRYMPTLAFGATQQPLELYQYQAYTDPSGEHFGLRDMPRLWGMWLEKWYKVQEPGVKFIAADDKPYFGIDSYSPNPNEIKNLKAITFPPTGKKWKVQVLCTTFDNAMAHLRKLDLMQKHGMPVVDNVELRGHSPALTLIYDLGIYVIPHSDPPPTDPLIDPNGGADTGTDASGGLGTAAGG